MYARSWTGGTISSSTKGITCSSTEENFSDISRAHKSLYYGIQKERIHHLFPAQMKIMQVSLMTDEAQVEMNSTWVSVWYLG